MENFRLKVFRAAAHSLNFRKASEELFITQPAVTQQIRALEEELGVSLFDRTKGKVTLTESGMVLHKYALSLKAIVDEAVQAIAEVSGTRVDELRVGASQTIGQYLLPNLLAAFRKDYPGVSLSGMSGNTDEVLTSLAEHRIDLALVEGPALRSDVKAEPFMEDHMVLVVPHDHEWADQDIDVNDLQSAAFVTREHGSGSRRVVEEALEQAGLQLRSLRTTMTLDTTEGILSAVEAGLGIAFVSRWAVRNQLSLGTLKLARVKGLKLSRVFTVAYRLGAAPQGSAGAFHRFLRSSAYDATPRPTGNLTRPRTRKPSPK
ncbi:LysR family transcriptional regulator [Granulicella arctica]|uniref:LysR family transcriptional regulator n=1 Tax=Granulicella arctica TaxID=940613 RepID=UPI0021E045D8|nr:LysR family transcriptional regulator [Granulicella arctica]